MCFNFFFFQEDGLRQLALHARPVFQKPTAPPQLVVRGVQLLVTDRRPDSPPPRPLPIPWIPTFLAAQLIHWFFLCLDELVFPAYRKVEVHRPVFITGIPRSGTTFLHRTLSVAPEYTSSQRGRPFRTRHHTAQNHLSARMDRSRLWHTWRSPYPRNHQKDLRRLRRDPRGRAQCARGGLPHAFPVGGCFIFLLAFPHSKELLLLSQLDKMPPSERDALLRFYKSCLKRHLYCHPGRTLLSKNAAFSSWGPTLRAHFPDAKIIVCIRRPDTALRSQLSSSHQLARSLDQTRGRHTTVQFSQIYGQSYSALAQFVANSKHADLAVIEQTDLRVAPEATIRNALQQLALTTRHTARDRAHSADRVKSTSTHKHRPADFQIDSAQIESCMQPAYETMLRSLNRITSLD